jgi:hypothetical protein
MALFDHAASFECNYSDSKSKSDYCGTKARLLKNRFQAYCLEYRGLSNWRTHVHAPTGSARWSGVGHIPGTEGLFEMTPNTITIAPGYQGPLYVMARLGNDAMQNPGLTIDGSKICIMSEVSEAAFPLLNEIDQKTALLRLLPDYLTQRLCELVKRVQIMFDPCRIHASYEFVAAGVLGKCVILLKQRLACFDIKLNASQNAKASETLQLAFMDKVKQRGLDWNEFGNQKRAHQAQLEAEIQGPDCVSLKRNRDDS